MCAKGSLAFLEVEDEAVVFPGAPPSVGFVVVGEGVVSITVTFPVVVVVFMRGRRRACSRKAISEGVWGPELSGRDVVEPLWDEGVDNRERDDELRNVCGQTAADGAVLFRRSEQRDGRGAEGR